MPGHLFPAQNNRYIVPVAFLPGKLRYRNRCGNPQRSQAGVHHAGIFQLATSRANIVVSGDDDPASGMIAADTSRNGCQISRVERDHYRQPGCFVNAGAGGETFHDANRSRIYPAQNAAGGTDRTVRELLLCAVSADELQRCQFSRVTSRNDQRPDQIVLENPSLNPTRRNSGGFWRQQPGAMRPDLLAVKVWMDCGLFGRDFTPRRTSGGNEGNRGASGNRRGGIPDRGGNLGGGCGFAGLFCFPCSPADGSLRVLCDAVSGRERFPVNRRGKPRLLCALVAPIAKGYGSIAMGNVPTRVSGSINPEPVNVSINPDFVWSIAQGGGNCSLNRGLVIHGFILCHARLRISALYESLYRSLVVLLPTALRVGNRI